MYVCAEDEEEAKEYANKRFINEITEHDQLFSDMCSMTIDQQEKLYQKDVITVL